ncbi:MAG: ApaG domain [Proteobacteria bacterium]|nr:ApaG domain [Pseudomonadota bacterium]
MKEYIYKLQTKDFYMAVDSFFSIDKSLPEFFHYVWEYKVTLKNKSKTPISILKSNWTVVDILGRTITLDDSSMIGRTQIVLPDEVFEYTYLAPLSSPMGMLNGWYDIEDQTGNKQTYKAPVVSLDSPFHDMLVN